MLRRACDVQPHDHVLDIGCGGGQTTRQAARTARAGSALGVDVSAPAIERARELARAEGLGNVTFERADAQVHRFPPEHFDLAISRFGTMFFADPVAAFANIGRALRPAGRLVMMVWQAARAQRVGRRHPPRPSARPQGAGGRPSGGPDPFSLADPPTVTEILAAAGFADVAFTDVHEPVYYGPDVAAALDWVRGFTAPARPGTAGSRRRDARGRAAARGARRAPGRRRRLVRLPRLDRHRAPPMRAGGVRRPLDSVARPGVVESTSGHTVTTRPTGTIARPGKTAAGSASTQVMADQCGGV